MWMNPWIGVVLIGIGTAADVTLIVTHNQVPSLMASVIVAGLGIVQAFANARARSNGKTTPAASNSSANGT
jgi:hypothetical protein